MGKAKQRYITALKKFQRTPETQRGTLGNVLGQVKVPNQPDMVYVMVAGLGAREVKNTKVANIPGTPVKIGYDPLEPTVFQVLDTVSYPQTYNAPQYTNGVGTHGATHNWAGNDVVWIEKRQLMPLRVTAIGGMDLALGRDVIWNNSQWVYHGGTTFNVSAAIPATGSRYVLIYAGITGSYGILTGTVRDLQTMLFSDLPAPIPGTTPSAIIRLYAGQTGISEGYNDTDIIDVRGLVTPIGSGMGGGTGVYDGSDITLDITNFNHNLSAADDNVQKALETLDELIADAGMINPMTHVNDIIYGGVSGSAERLGAGSDNQVLTLVSGTMSWATPATAPVVFHGAKATTAGYNIEVTDNSFVALTFDTEDYDTDTYHSTVSNTDRMTIPVGLDGYYNVIAYIDWDAYNDDLGTRMLSIYLGSNLVAESIIPGTPVGTMNTSQIVTTDVHLVAGNIIRAYVMQISGSTMHVYNRSLSIKFLGT